MPQKTQNHFLKFSIHLSVRKSRENYRQIYEKSKASLWRNLSTGRPQNFLGQSFALQLQFTTDSFFRTAVLRKVFDITFSYKHCNFSQVCLLVKMASKTVTRSIASMARRTAKIGQECSTVEISKQISHVRRGISEPLQENWSKFLTPGYLVF